MTQFKQELSRRNYKAGYSIIRGIVDGSIMGCDDFETTSATTPSGDYIGNKKTAHFLCKKKGIKPIKAKGGHSICSIGFCDQKQKWYGWSHRAIYGFGIGSKVSQGDCAYVPVDEEDFRLDSIRFWSDEYNENVTGRWSLDDDGRKIVRVDWIHSQNVPNEKLRGRIAGVNSYPPAVWGRGEWTAKSLEDAKQMAIDFAEDVS